MTKHPLFEDMFTDFEKRLIRYLLEQEWFRVHKVGASRLPNNNHRLAYLHELEVLQAKWDPTWKMDDVMFTSDVGSDGEPWSTMREVCKMCDKESAVGFTVPDSIWNELDTDGNLCIACFARLADLLRLEWDKDIRFWPVSRATIQRHAE